MGDIADELRMSKGTIVHHFGTKAQMLRELEETYLQRQLDAVRKMWERLSRPQERIAAIIFASTHLQVIARDATVASQREVVAASGGSRDVGVRRAAGATWRSLLTRSAKASRREASGTST